MLVRRVKISADFEPQGHPPAATPAQQQQQQQQPKPRRARAWWDPESADTAVVMSRQYMTRQEYGGLFPGLEPPPPGQPILTDMRLQVGVRSHANHVRHC